MMRGLFRTGVEPRGWGVDPTDVLVLVRETRALLLPFPDFAMSPAFVGLTMLLVLLLGLPGGGAGAPGRTGLLMFMAGRCPNASSAGLLTFWAGTLTEESRTPLATWSATTDAGSTVVSISAPVSKL